MEALPRHLLQLSNKHQIGQREDTLKKPLRVSGCWMLVCVNSALWKLGLVFRGNGRFPFDQRVRDISWLLASETYDRRSLAQAERLRETSLCMSWSSSWRSWGGLWTSAALTLE